MNRRGFLLGMAGILAAGVAPAFVRSESLMRIAPPKGWVLGPGGILTGEVGRFEGVRFVEGYSTKEVVKYMRSKALRPDANGNYTVFIPTSAYHEWKVTSE